jgi:hypothetical protein
MSCLVASTPSGFKIEIVRFNIRIKAHHNDIGVSLTNDELSLPFTNTDELNENSILILGVGANPDRSLLRINPMDIPPIVPICANSDIFKVSSIRGHRFNLSSLEFGRDKTARLVFI